MIESPKSSSRELAVKRGDETEKRWYEKLEFPPHEYFMSLIGATLLFKLL